MEEKSETSNSEAGKISLCDTKETKPICVTGNEMIKGDESGKNESIGAAESTEQNKPIVEDKGAPNTGKTVGSIKCSVKDKGDASAESNFNDALEAERANNTEDNMKGQQRVAGGLQKQKEVNRSKRVDEASDKLGGQVESGMGVDGFEGYGCKDEDKQKSIVTDKQNNSQNGEKSTNVQKVIKNLAHGLGRTESDEQHTKEPTENIADVCVVSEEVVSRSLDTADYKEKQNISSVYAIDATDPYSLNRRLFKLSDSRRGVSKDGSGSAHTTTSQRNNSLSEKGNASSLGSNWKKPTKKPPVTHGKAAHGGGDTGSSRVNASDSKHQSTSSSDVINAVSATGKNVEQLHAKGRQQQKPQLPQGRDRHPRQVGNTDQNRQQRQQQKVFIGGKGGVVDKNHQPNGSNGMNNGEHPCDRNAHIEADALYAIPAVGKAYYTERIGEYASGRQSVVGASTVSAEGRQLLSMLRNARRPSNNSNVSMEASNFTGASCSILPKSDSSKLENHDESGRRKSVASNDEQLGAITKETDNISFTKTVPEKSTSPLHSGTTILQGNGNAEDARVYSILELLRHRLDPERSPHADGATDIGIDGSSRNRKDNGRNDSFSNSPWALCEGSNDPAVIFGWPFYRLLDRSCPLSRRPQCRQERGNTWGGGGGQSRSQEYDLQYEGGIRDEKGNRMRGDGPDGRSRQLGRQDRRYGLSSKHEFESRDMFPEGDCGDTFPGSGVVKGNGGRSGRRTGPREIGMVETANEELPAATDLAAIAMGDIRRAEDMIENTGISLQQFCKQHQSKLGAAAIPGAIDAFGEVATAATSSSGIPSAREEQADAGSKDPAPVGLGGVRLDLSAEEFCVFTPETTGMPTDNPGGRVAAPQAAASNTSTRMISTSKATGNSSALTGSTPGSDAVAAWFTSVLSEGTQHCMTAQQHLERPHGQQMRSFQDGSNIGYFSQQNQPQTPMPIPSTTGDRDMHQHHNFGAFLESGAHIPVSGGLINSQMAPSVQGQANILPHMQHQKSTAPVSRSGVNSIPLLATPQYNTHMQPPFGIPNHPSPPPHIPQPLLHDNQLHTLLSQPPPHHHQPPEHPFVNMPMGVVNQTPLQNMQRQQIQHQHRRRTEPMPGGDVKGIHHDSDTCPLEHDQSRVRTYGSLDYHQQNIQPVTGRGHAPQRVPDSATSGREAGLQLLSILGVRPAK